MGPKITDTEDLCASQPMITIIPTEEKKSHKEIEEEHKNEKEQINDAIGEWGKWQLHRCIVILIIIWLPASFHLLNMVFYRADTDYWCVRPEKLSNLTVSDWRDLSDPGWRNETDPSKKSCYIRNFDYNKIDPDDKSSSLPDLIDPAVPLVACHEWEFDTSFWKRTTIMDFQLVCGDYHLRKLQQQITFIGIMFGVFASGFISDRFGRRKTMLLLLISTIIVGTITGFAPNYPSFLVGIFCCAFSALGYGTVMYVWMMEHVGGKYKTILGACPHYNFGFWGLMTAVIAYLVPDWRHLQIIFSAPLVLLIPAYWYLPESARWLLAKGRAEEAEVLVRNIARYNNTPVPTNFHLLHSDTKEKDEGGVSFFRLFTLPNLRKKTLICYYLWFATALTYYGLTLNSNTLGTDLFVTFMIGKALEFPSISLVIFLLLKTGRRATLMVFYSLAGVSLTLTIFVPLGYFTYEWPILILNLLGRISAINTLAVCYIYSAEVFPTVVRNVGLGSSSFWARVGPMIAPFIVDLRVYGDTVPLAVFGVIALLAAVLVTFMPETSHTPLPDTLQDGDLIGAGDTFWSNCRKKKQKSVL